MIIPEKWRKYVGKVIKSVEKLKRRRRAKSFIIHKRHKVEEQSKALEENTQGDKVNSLKTKKWCRMPRGKWSEISGKYKKAHHQSHYYIVGRQDRIKLY